MSSIKPPGGPSSVGIPTTPPAASPATGAPAGADFREKLAAGTESAQRPLATPGATPPPQLDTSRGVIEALRAGSVSPREAVRLLTDQAIARGNTPAALRPALEARVLALLQQDPLVRDLLKQMGAGAEDEP